MDNKIKKTDLDRKSKLVKDFGDDRRIEKYIASVSGQVTKINKDCDRGDSIARIGVEKVRLTDKRLMDILPRNIEHRETEGKPKDVSARIAEMKKIKENYTFRNKYSNAKRRNGECAEKNTDRGESEIKNERASKKLNDVVKLTTLSELVSSAKASSIASVKLDPRRNMPSKTSLSQQVIRRPIIKTITSKNDKSKVYKAVNFVERKVQPTQLQINIPTDMKKVKDKTKSVASKVSVKEKRKKEKHSFKPTTESPDVTVRIKSPPTEVAKWANVDHTKVYYEAWVDTTLAAISKKPRNKKIDSIKLIKSFQKALAERPISPDIDYNLLLDEKYTGKIRVNKR